MIDPKFLNTLKVPLSNNQKAKSLSGSDAYAFLKELAHTKTEQLTFALITLSKVLDRGS